MRRSGGKKRFEVLVSPEFRDYYRALRDEQLKRSIDSLVDVLEQTPLDPGDFVAGDRWPAEYRRVGLRNLYKADLARGARLTYTVTVGKDGAGLVRIVEFFPTHKDYAKRFGYEV